ncbi:MAG: glycosyl hydrolase family 28-related protein, partial [Caldilinea sp.]
YNGSPAQLFIDGTDYSILVQNRKGVDIYSFPSGAGIAPDASSVTYTPASGPATTVQARLRGYESSGGSVLVGYQPAGTGAVTRTVQDKLRESVSIKDFGAIGDGFTNDSAAFVAFLDYLVENGGVGFIPSGTYSIDPVYRNFTGSKPFSIVGEGKYNTILKNRSPNSSFLYWTAVNNFVLSDLTLDGDYTAAPVGLDSSGAHLGIVNSSYVTIKNVRMI